MATVLNIATVAARFQHRCHWCGEVIGRGDKYVRWAWVDCGINTVRVHPECKAAWDYAGSCIDRALYFEDGISAAEHRRGCCCERGTTACNCGMPPVNDHAKGGEA